METVLIIYLMLGIVVNLFTSREIIAKDEDKNIWTLLFLSAFSWATTFFLLTELWGEEK